MGKIYRISELYTVDSLININVACNVNQASKLFWKRSELIK